jgi:hypothetical protein
MIKKWKDPTNVTNTFNNYFITITEKLNILQIEKGDAVSILKDTFPENFPSWDKKYNIFLKTKNNYQVVMK